MQESVIAWSQSVWCLARDSMPSRATHPPTILNSEN